MSQDSADDRELFGVADFDLVLLANFVHQVINPLNGVAGTLDNLAEGVIREEHRRDLIRQVLMNIFDNCVKYSENNSIIEVNQRIQKKSNLR